MKYFPPAKSIKFRNEITSFARNENESLFDAWKRFKELLRKCCHHCLPSWIQILTFYKRLLVQNKTNVDVVVGGSLMKKSYKDSYTLLEQLSSNHCLMSRDKNVVKGWFMRWILFQL